MLTRSGEVWRVGGDHRTVTRLELGLDGVPAQLVAMVQVGVVVTDTGTIYSVSYKNKEKHLIQTQDSDQVRRRPVRIEKNNSKSVCYLHFTLS